MSSDLCLGRGIGGEQDALYYTLKKDLLPSLIALKEGTFSPSLQN